MANELMRSPWFGVLALLITLVLTHGYLRVRGIKPSKRVGLWNYISWEVFPKDEQTKHYLKMRLLTAVVVLPATLLILYLLLDLKERYF